MTVSALTQQTPGSVRQVTRALRPVAAGNTTYAGGIAVMNPGGAAAGNVNAGYVGEATGALGEIAIGRFYGQYGNVNNSTGSAGAQFAEVQFFRERFMMLVNNDTVNPVTAAQRETMVSILNDNYATLDTDGARADLGLFYDFSEDGSGQLWIEMPYPSSDQDQGPVPTPGGASMVARAVANASLPAYGGSGSGTLTASANGALASQDGVALAVGDVILLHIACSNLTALKDAGPYIVTSLGASGAPYVFTRPSWWFTGANVPAGASIAVSEGTVYAGTLWKVFAVKGQVVDTNDPVLFPKIVVAQVTLTNGVSPTNTIPLRSATKSAVTMSYVSGSVNAGTLGHQQGVITPATLGNAGAVTLKSYSAPGTPTTTGDSSVLNCIFAN